MPQFGLIDLTIGVYSYMLKLSANTGCSAHFGEPPWLDLIMRRQARRPRPIRSHRQGATSGPLRIPGALLRLATPMRRRPSSCLASTLLAVLGSDVSGSPG